MKFYEVDGALQQAIDTAEKPLRLRIELVFSSGIETVNERDIIEANFYGLKETAGGTSARGDLVLDNPLGKYSIANEKFGVGIEVRVSFSVGDGLPYFQRFTFFVDEKGIQDIKGSGRKRLVIIGLRDLSAKLRKSDESRDWTSPAVFTYSVVCDKTQPEKSLVHGIAKRAGFTASDIDCTTIPVTLPYVRLRRNIWAELSSLAYAYRCHLECPVEKSLLFAHSPYQTERLQVDHYSYSFTGENIFYFRKTAKAGYYRNFIRLKVNMPMALAKQEIWRYDEKPVFYDDDLQAYYPFKAPLVREIEAGRYEANYRIIDENGKERNIIYADDIDTQDEAETRLEYSGGGFTYSFYDVTTNIDKAVLTLRKDNDGDIYKAVIFGKPIVLDLNRSCFLRDVQGIATYGTIALNVTGAYFSEHEINGRFQYEDWAIRELAERLQNKSELTVKTHKALFNARVGAKVKISLSKEQYEGTINAFSFRYKKDKAFVATFRITEE